MTNPTWVESGVNGGGSNGAIEGVKGAKEVIGSGLVVGEEVQYLILIRDETT